MKPAIHTYFNDLPEKRQVALRQIREMILDLYPDAEESLTYKMPTYQVGDNWVAIGNQPKHFSVYTSSSDLIEPYLAKHPEISAGRGCLRFKDGQDVAMNDLRGVVVRAMTEH